jgi:hypothetical protein
MAFSKEHLEGLYNWSSENGTITFDGQPSRRLFNRWNGEQVLFIINLILDSSESSSIEQGRKIERLIINKLPFESSSELTVFNWLQKEIMVQA